MSLRWRFALIFGAAAIVATILVSAAAVVTTTRSLEREVDTFLTSRIDAVDRISVRRLPAGVTLVRAFGESGNDPHSRSPVLPQIDSLVQVNRRDGSLALTVEGEDVLPPTDIVNDHFTVEVDDTHYRVLAAELNDGAIIQVARDLSENLTVVDRMRSQALVLGAIFAALAALAGWLAARRVVTPVEELSRAAEQIAVTRNLTEPIVVIRQDEVGRLGTSFNTMLDALRTSREQQRRLVQDASHELRTPLTSLRTNIEVLQRAGTLTDDARADILVDIEGELRELSGLVTELVELATDADRSDEPLRDVSLAALVEGVVERSRRRTGRAIDIVGDGERVSVHPSMIERALSNLLDNAHKWSPADGPLIVSISGTRVAVLDAGPGIAENDLPKIFDRFYRADEARSKPGSGLGLAIVSQIIEAHGGTVFASNRPGGGAEVGFELR